MTAPQSQALADLHRKYPQPAALDERRTREVVALGLHTDHPAVREFAQYAGKRAVELGCRTAGPVQVAPGTWAHRSATGRTRVWNRPPTDAEIRALTGRTTKRAKAPTATTSRRPKAPATARVERLFH